jgi:Spy/CpxP family protein refolding chaperone
MKKVLFSLLAVAAITISANAQVTKGNPQHPKDGMQFHHGRHMHGPMLKNLNLTDGQKQQLKSDNEELRNKLKALKSNDNITMKDFKAQKEALMQERKAKFQSLLTAEQKAQLEKQKSDMKVKREEMGAKRMERMKTDLALTNDQVNKFRALNESTKSQIESIRNNESLTREQKKEQLMNLRKTNEETMKNLLTAEQLKKRDESRAKRMEEFKNKRKSNPGQGDK